MKPVTRDDLERRYGYLLNYCARHGCLDVDANAASHVEPAIMAAFIAEMSERVGSVTLYGTIYKIRRMAEILNADRDFAWLRAIEIQLDQNKRPRPKYDRLVDPTRIVEAGLGLMAPAMTRVYPTRADIIAFRNGLMIALLALCPIRLKNFAALRFGETLCKAGDDWWIILENSTVKSGRADERPIPPLLSSYLDRWQHLRERAFPGAGNGMWPSTAVGMMSYKSVGRLVSLTTPDRLGTAVNPHLFRDCSVHLIADRAGDQFQLASALLQHRDQRVTERHYNKGTALAAIKRYQFAALTEGDA